MKLNIAIFSIFFFYSFLLNATNIRVINLNSLIDNTNELRELVTKIENDQTFHRDKFLEKELILQSKISKIEELKLILDNSELEKEISKYNNDLNNFNNEISEFNLHYEKQINNLKSDILDKILEILKKYSLDNQIDLILDSNNYILASNSINITNLILDEINKINFETSFEKFK